MTRLLVVAMIGLLFTLGCGGGDRGPTPPRSGGEPGTKDTRERKPTSDSGPADGAPGSGNRSGGAPNR